MHVGTVVIRGFTISFAAEMQVLKMLAASGGGFAIRSIDISMKGKINTDTSIACRLTDQAGGSAGSPVTPRFLDSQIEAAGGPSLTATKGMTTPTNNYDLHAWRVHAQGSRMQIWPIDQEMPKIGSGSACGLAMQAVEQDVDCDITVTFLE